jgi:hypothetical protein
MRVVDGSCEDRDRAGSGSPSSQFLCVRVHNVRAGTARRIAKAAAVALGFALLFLAADELTAIRSLHGLALAGFQVLAVLAVAVRYLRIPRWMEVRVSESGVDLCRGARKTSIPRERFVSGLTVPNGARHRVELTLQSGNVIAFDVGDEEEGTAIIRAAGLSATQCCCAVRVGTLRSWVIPGALLAIVVPTASSCALALVALLLTGPLPQVAAAIWFWATVIVYALSLRAVGPPTVLVGADGVAIERGKSHTFLSYERIRRVDLRHGTLRFSLTDGSVVSIVGAELDPNRLEALRLRIEEARRARAGAGEAKAAAALDRRGQSAGEWRRRLLALVRGIAGYRRVAVSADELERVLENPAASAEHRIGAALAISALGGAEAKARIRTVAGACASVPMRIALERAASDELDDETLDQALTRDALA